MRLLVLGGTRFLGRAVVQAALAQGHVVTTFTRGLSGPAPHGAEELHGDRDDPGALEALGRGTWDAVVDTSGFIPASVGLTVRALAGQAGRYLFVSTCAAYQQWPGSPVTASSPTWPCAADAPAAAGDYGYLKAGCERAVLEVFGTRAVIVRAGFIAGPRDDNGRVPWWLRRIAAGGQVLAPGDPDRRIRLIDVRDVGAWLVHAAQQALSGEFLVAGPAAGQTMAGLFEACREVTQSDALFTWIPDGALLAAGAQPMVEFPLWDPAPALWNTDTAKAEAAGLTTRDLLETLADTWRWLRELPAIPVKEGLPAPGTSPEREAALLAATRDRAR